MEPTRPLGNSLLDHAKDTTLDAMRSHFDVTRMSAGEVLFEVGDVIAHVWFPISGVVSLCATTGDGDSVGLASIGAEGLIGGSIALGFRSALCRAVVQVEGEAVRIEAAPFARALQAHPELQASVLAYMRELLLQTVQSTACSRFHTAEQRVSRWLLETADRTGARTFPVTHEFLALTLGMRRPWVTRVIRRLRDQGCIRFRRGELAIADRKRLERAACECYSSLWQQLRNPSNASGRLHASAAPAHSGHHSTSLTNAQRRMTSLQRRLRRLIAELPDDDSAERGHVRKMLRVLDALPSTQVGAAVELLRAFHAIGITKQRTFLNAYEDVGG